MWRVPERVSWCRWSCGLPHPWVERHIDRVRDEVRGQHDQGDHDEYPLHPGVVDLAQRVVQVEADARVGEDDLDQDLRADDEADGDGAVGEAWEERVAHGVP